MHALELVRSDLLRLKWHVAAMRFQLALRKHAIVLKAGFNPDQPRDDLGRWTETGQTEEDQETSDADVTTDFSGAERPRSPGRLGALGALGEAAQRLIDAYRRATDFPDFFDIVRGDRTVAVTNIDGEDIFGSSSKWPSYTDVDDRDATRVRDTLIAKHPEIMNTENIGQAPNNALFHAESNILMRAARRYGGSLAGKEFDVYVDRGLCRNCRTVLPLLSRELGNPTVRFFDGRGRTLILRGGAWVN